MRPASASTIRRWAFAAAALACAILAGLVATELQRQAQVHDLRGHAGDAKVPPGVALLTKATGGFRAMFLIALWIRATDLQDSGKLFELNDLYRLITQLEPRFSGVWAYWAWNVAYNCSVKFRGPSPLVPPTSPEDWRRQLSVNRSLAWERWRWVKLGIEILRDDGIQLNPKAPILYRELGWIYSHKIAQDSDDAHFYYKVFLAEEIEDALGAPDYVPTGGGKGPLAPSYLARLKAIAAAPKTRDDLLRDPAVKDLVESLKKADVDPFARSLDVANRAVALPPKALDALNSEANAAAAAKLETYLRATHLRDRMKLDVNRMLGLMTKYGSIDWRLPDAQALYWNDISVEVFGADLFAVANADRTLFHSFVQLYYHGYLRFHRGSDDEIPTWVASPNFGFLDAVIRLREWIAERHKDSEYAAEPTREGYLNFLRQAILDLYLHHDPKRAAALLEQLNKLGGAEPASLDQFVQKRYDQLLEGMTIQQAMNLVRDFFFRSLMWASLGDTDRALGEQNQAEALYHRYRQQNLAPRILVQIPTLRELWLDALAEAVRRLRKFQVDELRRLYPSDVELIEKQFKRLQEESLKRLPPAPAPPNKK
ncbi:MAG: hypothetical protein FJ290_24530 [Planctomycetes bacterium]|nr:hypothetical protein [Planctomycetota bacterium]